MAYSAQVVANFFLSLSVKDRVPISPMKIQKLLYLAHGYHLGMYDAPLIEENFEAWKFGPVISAIYHDCKHYGRTGITRLLPATTEATQRLRDDDQATGLIEFVWETYGTYDPLLLSRWTHQKGGPWDKTKSRLGLRSRSGDAIDDDLIKEYFEAAIERSRKEANNNG